MKFSNGCEACAFMIWTIEASGFTWRATIKASKFYREGDIKASKIYREGDIKASKFYREGDAPAEPRLESHSPSECHFPTMA